MQGHAKRSAQLAGAATAFFQMTFALNYGPSINMIVNVL
jgi:hypothetical protein